jgi:hypothetical protein
MNQDFTCMFCSLPVKATRFYMHNTHKKLIATCYVHFIVDNICTEITLKEAICAEVIES